jgi:signal transduction histidine kinase
MTRRLLASYLTVTLLVLAALVIPLGVTNARSERRDLTTKIERDAVALASLAEDAVDPAGGDTAALAEIAERYRQDTGGRVVVVDSSGLAIVDTEPPEPGPRSFSSRPEFQSALAGEVSTGVRRSDTLDTDLLYVALPVARSGVVNGALRISYPKSEVDERVLRYWLILAAIAAVVLAVVWGVGLRLARSIAKPLADVERAAAAARGGDLTARAPVGEGPEEVRSLAASFNRTVAALDDLIRSRDVFVADASHQLRTPLAALRLRLENLERDVAPEARGDLEAALAEVERLSRLVDGLLALARADAASAHPEPHDLDVVVAERLEAWGPLAAEQDVSLEHRVEPGLAALATPGRVEQVLDNLLANALEVSHPGSAITVTGDRAGRFAEVHVRDQGPGMAEGERAHAFDRFWSRRTSEGGTGLGLAIVERLVTSDGGEVELLEASGGGLDAVVRLPLLQRGAPRGLSGNPATAGGGA